MYFTVNSEKTIISFEGEKIKCSCVVKNEINKWRGMNEIVKTIPDKIPYMPRIFPSGEWIVGLPMMRSDDYKKPYFIPTNAFQMVDEWEVKNGMYIRKTGKTIKDTGYGFHCSTSGTTHGCIKIHDVGKLLYMVEEIVSAIEAKEKVSVIVE